jgi:glycosyltransferase involved in cell wall biosynthesis
MESIPRVSIIVPVYKVEAYLAECVESLLRQTYREIEIILVDDGSPDNCGAMCDAYALRDSRVKVIHQENRGLSVARNSGLDIATGEYVAFVDSDDLVSEDYIACLLKNVINKNADMSACRIADFRDGHSPALTVKGDVTVLSSEQALRMFFYQDRLQTNVLGKLFRRTLLPRNMFEPGILYEDAEPMYRALRDAGRMAWSDAVLAGYRHRVTAQSRQKFSLREMDCITVWQKIEKDVSAHCPQLVIPVTCRAFSAYSHIFFMIPDGTYETESKQIWELIKARRKTVLSDPNARKKARAAALLSYLGMNVMKSVGSYLLARENLKIYKERE